MALTQEALNKHFEKSERMNLLQERIKAYATLLQDRYNKAGWEVVRDIHPLDRRKARGLDPGKEVMVSIADAKLWFYCFINSDDPGLSQECRFYLFVGEELDEKWYDLTKDNLPSRLIETIYGALPQLTELMMNSGDQLAYTIASQMEQEILYYLK